MSTSVPNGAHLSPAALASGLRALEPRAAAVLVRRLVERRPSAECATWYGIPAESFQLLQLRAGVALSRGLGAPARLPASEDEETAWARMLDAALERDSAPLPVALVPVADTCRRLNATGPEVEAALADAARSDAESPKRRREDWLRRLAVLALLAITAWLYWTRPAEPTPRPERHMASPERR
ncbi:hypothetical protein DRW03_23655 [Corallococcus sp. H22C18031201]|uniref:hypothetical protein n=1 Tax=Citreicoccus inhibens TaxID=2849499 RepID=UPI000E725FDB|nr:hypothetical protein [Citreicoccus inhibens]MBU8896624.1 hypothetical protein [Citreicoccus inhibens]RJS18832.1 hypothetical protein DRW03_23655 [Corallococcus sp. H22C18031201]